MIWTSNYKQTFHYTLNLEKINTLNNKLAKNLCFFHTGYICVVMGINPGSFFCFTD